MSIDTPRAKASSSGTRRRAHLLGLEVNHSSETLGAREGSRP
jgi:hypothetical protein